MIPSITAVRLTGARHRAELPAARPRPVARHLRDDALVALCGRAHRRLRRARLGPARATATTGPCPTSPSPWPSWPRACCASSTTCWPSAATPGAAFFYAGDSVGGAVGLQLLLDRPDRVTAAALLCTGAKIGDEAMWTGRIAQVSVSGTPVMVSGSAERWFGPGFLERSPRSVRLLHALQEADDEGYAQVC